MKAATLLIILLLATAAYAANATLSPATVYETTKAWQTLSVNNYKGSSIISKVTVTSPSLLISGAETYLGWTTVQDSDSAEWKDGVIATNVKNAAFEFEVSAGTVTDNVTANVSVELDSATSSVVITILNDATPPAISGVVPNDYAKANNAAQPISVTVSDPETSVSSVTYSYNNCLGGASTNVSLTKTADTYTGTADFSSFDEGMKACYTIIAQNTPGETASLTGELLFDGTAPTATIIAPTSFAAEETTFTFNASDNLAAVISCDVILGTTTLATINVTNGSTESTTQNLTGFDEGSQTWSLSCKDGVGLTATPAQAILLDKFPPSITLDYSSMVPRTASSSFQATIVDTVGLALVNATFDGSAITLSKTGDVYTGSFSSDTLGTKTLVIMAADDVGHISTKTVDVIIVPNHILTLSLSPATANPDETITASGSLTFDGNSSVDKVTVKTPSGDDEVDLVSGDYSTTFTAPDAGTYVITAEFTEGGYTYKTTATLSVVDPGSSSQQTYYTNGIGAEAWRTSGYVKPDDPEPQNPDGNSNQQTEETPPPAPAAYEPLPPEAPRQALTPKTTGVFDLGGAIKWLAVLLALALLIALGVYGYGKRKTKEDGGIDWNNYFKNN